MAWNTRYRYTLSLYRDIKIWRDKQVYWLKYSNGQWDDSVGRGASCQDWRESSPQNPHGRPDFCRLSSDFHTGSMKWSHTFSLPFPLWSLSICLPNSLSPPFKSKKKEERKEIRKRKREKKEKKERKERKERRKDGRKERKAYIIIYLCKGFEFKYWFCHVSI